jgi:hypothetical protein
MKKRLILLLMLFSMLILSGCSRISVDQYIKTVETDSDFVREAVAGDIKVKVRYLPRDYFVAKNIQLRNSNHIDDAQLAERNDVYLTEDDSYFFSVEYEKIVKDSVKVDPISHDVDPYKYADNLYALLFNAKENIFLIDSEGYKVKAINDHFQRNFGILATQRLLLAFPKTINKGVVEMFIDELGNSSIATRFKWNIKKIHLKKPAEVEDVLNHIKIGN